MNDISNGDSKINCNKYSHQLWLYLTFTHQMNLSKKIYTPKMIVDVWCYIHLRWSYLYCRLEVEVLKLEVRSLKWVGDGVGTQTLEVRNRTDLNHGKMISWKKKSCQIAKRGSNENNLACILESTHEMCLQLATAQMTKLPWNKR